MFHNPMVYCLEYNQTHTHKEEPIMSMMKQEYTVELLSIRPDKKDSVARYLKNNMALKPWEIGQIMTSLPWVLLVGRTRYLAEKHTIGLRKNGATVHIEDKGRSK